MFKGVERFHQNNDTRSPQYFAVILLSYVFSPSHKCMSAGIFFGMEMAPMQTNYFHGKLDHAKIWKLLEDFASRLYQIYRPVVFWRLLLPFLIVGKTFAVFKKSGFSS